MTATPFWRQVNNGSGDIESLPSDTYRVLRGIKTPVGMVVQPVSIDNDQEYVASRFLTKNQVESFSARLDVGYGPGGCWNWRGQINNDGYGVVRFGQTDYPVQDISFMLVNGYYPTHLLVPVCLNKTCGNPFHWYGEEVKEIVDTKVNRLFGESNGRSVLTWDLVHSIRTEYNKGSVTTRQLAAKYGISPTQVSRILRQENWPSHDKAARSP